VGFLLENDVHPFPFEDVVILDSVSDGFPAFLNAQTKLLHIRRKPLKGDRSVWTCQIFESVELIFFKETFLVGDLAPSNQIVGSLLIPLGWQSRLDK
jgi:hypothetical protein